MCWRLQPITLPSGVNAGNHGQKDGGRLVEAEIELREHAVLRCLLGDVRLELLRKFTGCSGPSLSSTDTS